MLNSQLPTRFPIPFGNGAGGSFIRPIPVPSQQTIDPGAASLTDGFPPDTFIPVSAGGEPPNGADFNGILNQSTAWNRWQAVGGMVPYNAAFASAIGGYPMGSLLRSSVIIDDFWLSMVDNNLTDPDSASATNWISYGRGPGDLIVDPSPLLRQTALRANGLTIGSASSGASALASATAILLYRNLWLSYPNTVCPVTGGRGANPDADFAANKPIQLPAWQGSGIVACDTMGGGATTLLANVPVIVGNPNTPGSLLGENFHALNSNENGPHIHGITDPGHTNEMILRFRRYSLDNAVANALTVAALGPTDGAVDAGPTQSAFTGVTVNSSGFGTPHNNVERSITTNLWLKL
jgi:hypothetical protein